MPVIMKKIVLLIVIVFAFTEIFAQQQLQLLSPDKTIRAEINTSKLLSYSVYVDDNKIIDKSAIDMQLNDGLSLSKNLSIKSTKAKSINEVIVAQIPVSRKIYLMYTMN